MDFATVSTHTDAIAGLERYRRWILAEIENTEAALLALRQPRREAVPSGLPFQSKYEQPGHVYCRRILAAAPQGMPAREIQTRLSEDGFDFTNQAIRLMLAKLERKGDAERYMSALGEYCWRVERFNDDKEL